MSKSRSQKLIEAAMLIKNNCQGLKSRDKCKKCVFNSDGESTMRETIYHHEAQGKGEEKWMRHILGLRPRKTIM